jgi:multisubunit Na+/H+ antiporter MnhG subunit
MTADTRLTREGGTTMPDPRARARVPVRTIAATIGMVLLTAAVLLLGWEVRRVLTWIVVAALLAIILGPLLAIPVAGVLHVIGRDLYDSYHRRLKPEPTTGADELPVSQPRPLEPGEQQPRDVTAHHTP